MNNRPDKREIAEALESIREIKKTLQGNMLVLRPFLYSKRFVFLCLVTAVVFAVFFGLLYAAGQVYGSLGALPLAVKAAFGVFLIAIIVWAGWYKWQILLKSGREKKPDFSAQDLFLIPEIYRLSLSSAVLFVAMAVFGIIFCLKQGSWNMLLPLSFLYYAFLCLHYSLSLYLTAYGILGLISCMLMIITALFMEQNPLLWLGGSQTAFYLSFALVVYFAGRRS